MFLLHYALARIGYLQGVAWKAKLSRQALLEDELIYTYDSFAN